MGAGVHIHGAGEDVDLPPALVWADIEIGVGLTDLIHGDGLFGRIVHGDHVGVVPREDLAALGAAQTWAFVAGRALHGRGQKPCQGVFAAAARAAEQIAVGEPILPKRRSETGFQLFVAQ